MLHSHANRSTALTLLDVDYKHLRGYESKLRVLSRRSLSRSCAVPLRWIIASCDAFTLRAFCSSLELIVFSWRLMSAKSTLMVSIWLALDSVMVAAFCSALELA